jgi:hypothetical protein
MDLLSREEGAELNRLRRENREPRRQKDFFRLAAAHLASEQLPPRGSSSSISLLIKTPLSGDAGSWP